MEFLKEKFNFLALLKTTHCKRPPYFESGRFCVSAFTFLQAAYR